jgi:hypothetical protein
VHAREKAPRICVIRGSSMSGSSLLGGGLARNEAVNHTTPLGAFKCAAPGRFDDRPCRAYG